MPSRLITYSILQDSQDPDTIYLGTNLGVYRSVDRGTSWAPVWAQEPDPSQKKRSRKRSKQKTTGAPQTRHVGKPSEIILRAQQALSAAGYQVGPADGLAGKLTLAGLKKFQADRNLPVTGMFDQLSLAALGLSSEEALAEAQNVVLTDAVNQLIPTVDETGKRGVLAATNVGLFISFEPAKGWKKIPFGSGFDSRTTCVASSLKEPQTIWVGTASSGVLVSPDWGQTWQQATEIPTDAPINTIVQDSQKLDHVYVGTKRAFYLSHDGGESWSRRGGNLPFGDFTSILVNPHNSDEIFVGNAYQTGEVGGGVFRSLNRGMTWARIDPKDRRLPSQRIWSLAFDSREQNLLFVGSHSAGVYVVPRSLASLSSSQ
jgi:peptidoglycan hydrolase-like protein with peptidoglycan-binding domain